MAFGNGVLMRGPRFWAWARADGTVVEGHVSSLSSRHRWLRTPFLRSLVMFAEMIGLTLQLHRRNGLRRGAWLVAWLGVCLVLDFFLSALVPLVVSNSVVANILVEVLGLGVGLLALRQGLGKTVWRYHGAEHKAVNAYEGGADLGDTRAVMTYSRIHDRCGTNLVVIIFLLLMLAYLPIGSYAMGTALSLAYEVAVIAIALEFFRAITRKPKSPLSRVVLAGGRTLQRCVTTREPQREHLEIACVALRRVVDLENGARPYMRAA